MSIASVQEYIIAHRRTISSVVVVLVVCYLLYWYSLGSLLPGFASQELATRSSALSLSNIWSNPLNAPYNFSSYLLLHINDHSQFWNRATSAILATLASFMFFFIVKRWHGKQVAVLATALFAASGWLLHVGRLDSPAITLLILPLLLFWLSGKFKHCSKHYNALTIGASLIISLLLYTPGAIYFVTMAVIWNWSYIASVVSKSRPWAVAIAAFLPLAALISLAIAMYNRTSLISQWFGVASLPTSILGFLKNWADSLIYLFAHGPNQPVFWLGRLPMLDIFSTAMVVLAVVFYFQHRRHHVWRIKLLLSFSIIASLLMAVGNSLYVSALVPIACLMVATGIGYLLREWYRVFPNNSLARGAGLALITLAVAIALTYHVSSYFIAWRHDEAVVRLFRHQL